MIRILEMKPDEAGIRLIEEESDPKKVLRTPHVVDGRGKYQDGLPPRNMALLNELLYANAV